MTPKLIGFVSKVFPLKRHRYVTIRYQQKMYTVVFESGHAPEQYPKITFRFRQSVNGWSMYDAYVAQYFPEYFLETSEAAIFRINCKNLLCFSLFL